MEVLRSNFVRGNDLIDNNFDFSDEESFTKRKDLDPIEWSKDITEKQYRNKNGRERKHTMKEDLTGIYSTGRKGFFFQQRRGHLNLRSLASVDLDRLIREVDVDVLQLHIENLAFCNLREEDLRYLSDPQVIKMFKISQLIIEYLLFSQDQLVENLDTMSLKYAEKKRFCEY